MRAGAAFLFCRAGDWRIAIAAPSHGSRRHSEASTSLAASKLPLTVNELALGLAVSLLTPSTFLTVSLIALLQAPQQLWTPATVSLVTLPGVTPLSSLIANVLLPVSP